MLVERRRDGMSAQSALHVGIAWLAVSALLAVVNISVISISPLAYSGDTARLVLFLSPPFGADTAELIALIAVPAFTLGMGMSLAARLTWRLIGDREVMLTCLAMAISAPLLIQMGPTQIEHGGWQLVCALLAVNGLVARSPRTGGWITGLSLAAWISLSIESWPLVAAILGITGLRWLRDRADRMWLVHIVQAMAVGSIAIYMVARDAGDLAAYCDRIGPAHIAMLCWGGLVLSALSRAGPMPMGALLGGFSLATGGALGILWLAPPICGIEGTPLWRQDLDKALEAIALPLIGTWAAIQLAARNTQWLRRWWCDYALILIAALAVTIFTGRDAAIAAALSAAPLGWQLCNWLDRIGGMKNPVKRVVALVLLAALLMPSLVIKIIPMIEPSNLDYAAAQIAFVSSRG